LIFNETAVFFSLSVLYKIFNDGKPIKIKDTVGATVQKISIREFSLENKFKNLLNITETNAPPTKIKTKIRRIEI
jgi:hypothetical protein